MTWIGVIALAAAATTVERTAMIGILHRLTASGQDLGSYWHGVSCAATLALRHANSRNGSVVAELANLTRTNFIMDGVDEDSQSTPLAGITAYRRLAARGAHAIVGPCVSGFQRRLTSLVRMLTPKRADRAPVRRARSAVSTPTAQLGSIDRLPQISCAREDHTSNTAHCQA
jgi:hypothetical protein